MANNRMWLVYRPTGTAVFLGKRMSEGWYAVPDDIKQRVEALFEHVFNEPDSHQDDFCIAMEEGGGPFVLTDWRYKGPSGTPFTTLTIEDRDAIPNTPEMKVHG